MIIHDGRFRFSLPRRRPLGVILEPILNDVGKSTLYMYRCGCYSGSWILQCLTVQIDNLATNGVV